jgi:hypothetical protein
MDQVYLLKLIDADTWAYYSAGRFEYGVLNFSKLKDQPKKMRTNHEEVVQSMRSYEVKNKKRIHDLMYIPQKCNGPGCDCERDLSKMYRCFFCKDAYYCEACAGQHFGHKYLTSKINHLVGSVQEVLIASELPEKQKERTLPNALRRLESSFHCLYYLVDANEDRIKEEVNEIVKGICDCLKPSNRGS